MGSAGPWGNAPPLPERPVRSRVRQPHGPSAAARARPAVEAPPAGTAGRHLLCRPHRLPMACPTARVPALADGLLVVPALPPGRYLGAAQRDPAPARARPGWTAAAAERVQHRQPERQDLGRGWPARLRRWQEDQWPHTPHRGRHPRLGAQAIVHSAAIQERATIPLLLDGITEQFPRLEHVWLDQGYTGSGRQWIEQHLGWSVQIVQHPSTWERGFRRVMDPVTGFRLEWITIKGKKGFQGVLPRRWVVERTFSWLLHSRRLVRDYERLTATDEALIYATMSRLMLRRPARMHARA